MSQYMTGEEVMAHLRVSADTLTRYRETGQIEAVRRGKSGEFIYVRQSVEAFLIPYQPAGVVGGEGARAGGARANGGARASLRRLKAKGYGGKGR